MTRNPHVTPFDHEKEAREYFKIMRNRSRAERRGEIEKAMRTRREDLHKLLPNPQPLLTAAEIDEGIRAMEATAFLNSTSQAERELILRRGSIHE